MDIILKVIKNGTYHQDFLIKIGETEIIADTYYFWIEEFGKLADPYEGIIDSISNYLSNWVKELEKLHLNECVFMPIDFSDEYVGGLKVLCLIESFEIEYGYITDINDIVVRVTQKEVFTNLNNKEFQKIKSFSIKKNSFSKLLHLS